MRQAPDSSKAGSFSGLWFVFLDEPKKIALWASSITGKQEVYVDDQLVSSCRSMLVRAKHEFSISEIQYEIELVIEKLKKGSFRCVLKKSGVVVDAYATEYNSKSSVYRRYYSQLVIIFFFIACFANEKTYWAVAALLLLIWMAIIYWPQEGKGYRVFRQPALSSTENAAKSDDDA